MALMQIEGTSEFVLTLFNFKSGLNTRDVETLIRDYELSGGRNFTYDSRGGLSIRKGYAPMNISAWGANPIKGGTGYYRTGADREEIVSAGTSIGTRVAEGTAIANLKTNLSGNGERFAFHQYLDHLFMANTTDNLMVYDGVNAVYDIGYIIPASNCTLADGGAGSMGAGKYYYKITYKYIDGESNQCAADVNITIAASKQVALSAIPTGSAMVTGRAIYRTTAGGSVYKLLTIINDNTTTTYADNIADAGLGADIDVDNIYTYIRPCKYMVNHKGRMWYAGNPTYPSTIFYSKSLSPEANPALYFWDIGKGDGDVIAGLAVNLGALVILKQYSTWVISGDTPVGTSADMILENVNPSIGTLSHWTISHAGNDLLFLSPKVGVQRLKRIILSDTESMDTEALSDKISTTINDDLQQSILSIAHGRAWNNKYYLFVPALAATACNLAAVLYLSDLNPEDESTIRWMVHDNQVFSSSWLYRDSNGEHLHAGLNSTGYIFEIDNGTTDDGAVIQAWAATKNFEFGSFMTEKVFRSLAVSGHASEDYEFSVREFILERNYDPTSELAYKFSTEQHVHDFKGGGVVSDEDVTYDEIIYDDVMYDSESDYAASEKDFLHGDDMANPGYKLKLKIEDVSANQDFVFYGFEVRGFYGFARII